MAQLQSTGITGSLTVTGNITAQEFHTEYVSSSILHESGSTSFGNTSDDVHNFTGSLNVLGEINTEGNVNINSVSNVGMILEHATRPTFALSDGTNRGYLALEGGGNVITGTTDNDLAIRSPRDIVFGYNSTETAKIDTSGNSFFKGQLTILKSQISSDIATTSAIRLKPGATTDTTGKSSIFLGTSTVDNYGISLRGARLGNTGTPSFEIATHSNSANGDVRIKIDSVGQTRIGIGGKKTSFGDDRAPTTVLTVYDIQDSTSYSGINIKQYNDPFDNQGFFGMINAVGGSFNLVAKSGGTIKFMDGQSSATNMEIDGSGNIKFNNYGAGLLTSDANGDITVDTSTYLVSNDLSGYLLNTTDTLTGTLSIANSSFTGLNLTRNSTNGSSINFNNSNGLLGRSGFLSNGTFAITNGIEGTYNMLAIESDGDIFGYGSVTINKDGDALNLRSTTNAVKPRLTFSSDVPAVQIGHIEYSHQDSVSYGSNESFVIGGTEGTMTILADGKLMYNEGIYSKPATGTGAGTRKDTTWDTAYGWGDHSTEGYLDQETDTLATVTGRGASTTTAVTFQDLTVTDGSVIINSNYVNYEFTHIENATIQYWLLCFNAGANDVNGTLIGDRSSGHHQAMNLDIVISAKSASMQTGMITSKQVLESNEKFTLVSLTYNSNNYIAIKYEGHAYPITDHGYFTGLVKSSIGSDFLKAVLPADVSSVAAFSNANTKATIQANVVGINTADPLGQLDVTDGNSKMIFDGASSDRPLLYFQHNAVPVDGEEVGLLDFRGHNELGEDTRYVIFTAKAEDVTNASEDGSLTIMTMSGGTATSTLTARSGKVGIGTTNPSQLLDVIGKIRVTDDIIMAQQNGRIDYDGNVSTGALRFFSTSANEEKMRISSAGLVGIGTTVPADPLHVYGAGEQWIRVASSDGGVSGYRTETSTGSRQNTLYRDSTSNLLTLRAGTDDGEIAFIAGGSTAERIRIDSSGNVGIGTTDPGTTLELGAAVNVAPKLRITLNDSGNSIGNNQEYGGIQWKGNDGQGDGVRADIRVFGQGTSGETYMTLGTMPAGTSASTNAQERIRINASGNVGINDTTNSAKLGINGGAVKIKNIVSSSPDSNLRRNINIASFTAGGAQNTGQLIIETPAMTSGAMGNFKLSGWQYDEAWELNISGYLRIGVNRGWEQIGGATLTGNPPFDVDEVRLCYNENTDIFYIILGTSTTFWDYYASIVIDADSIYLDTLPTTGWDMGISTSDPSGLTDIVTLTNIAMYGSTDAYIPSQVGIGINSPETALHLYKLSPDPTLLTLHNHQPDINSNGTQGNFIDFKMTDGNDTFTPQARIGMLVKDSDGDTGVASEGAGNFVIYTGEGTNSSGGGALTEHFRVTDKGSVGIGTNDPSSLLHIYKASGDPMLNIQAVASGDPGITFTSIDNRTGNIFYSDGTTNAKLSYDHADTSFKLYAHNTTVADFVLNETTAYFPSQNVGIGTTNPASGKLVIEGAPYVKTNSGKALGGIDLRTNAGVSTGDYGAAISFGANGSGRAAISSVQGSTDADRQGLVFFTHGSGTGAADSAEAMRISHDGKVGIASESPAALLDISDRVYIDTYSSEASGNNPVISGYLKIIAGGKTGWGVDDQLGKIEFFGADASGVGARTAASILAVCETGNGTSTTTFSSGLAFYTSPPNAAQEERIRISDDGNVGIGVTDPQAKLEVMGASATPADGNEVISVTNTTGGTKLLLGVSENAYGWIQSAEGGTLRSLLLNPLGGTVGIGTTSASETLEVNGTIKLTSTTTTGVNHIVMGEGSNRYVNYRLNDTPDNTPKIYIILCVNAAYGDVNGTIKMDRTSGLRFATTIDVVVSAGSATSCVGGLRSFATAGVGKPQHKLVNVVYDNGSGTAINHIAVEVTNPDNYYETTGVYFTGRSSNVSIMKSVLPASVSNVTDFENNTRFNQQGESVFKGKVGIDTNPSYTLEVNAGNGLFVGDSGAAVLAANPTTGVFSIGDTDVLGDGVYMTNTGTSKIDIYADSSVIFRVDVNGNVHADGDVVAFSTTVSDKRLKDNILTIGDPLGKIKALRGVEYDWNNGSRKGQHDLGLIAQEVEEVLPMLVREHEMPLLDGAEDGTIYKTVDYEKLVALLVEGMKEQQETIDKLEERIKKLENR